MNYSCLSYQISIYVAVGWTARRGYGSCDAINREVLWRYSHDFRSSTHTSGWSVYDWIPSFLLSCGFLKKGSTPIHFLFEQITQVSKLASSVAFGWVIDHFGCKTAMMIALLGSSVAYFLIAMGSSLGHLVWGKFLFGWLCYSGGCIQFGIQIPVHGLGTIIFVGKISNNDWTYRACNLRTVCISTLLHHNVLVTWIWYG